MTVVRGERCAMKLFGIDLCHYKDIFGRPREGAQSYRIFDIAVVDVAATVIVAFFIARVRMKVDIPEHKYLTIIQYSSFIIDMGEAAPDDQLSSLTLLIQCHGTITRGLAVTCENVEVLSLVGRPGVKGESGRSTKPEHKGQTNDFMMGTQIRDVYRTHMKNDDDDHDDDAVRKQHDHHDLLAKVATPLRELNECCDIRYEGGYQIHYNPTELRTFYFQPNDHECCRCCTKEGHSRCTYARTMGSTGSAGTRRTDKDIVWTPEYGIFPIISSNVEDYYHTVVSIHDTDQAGKKRPSQSSDIPDEHIEIQPKNILGKARREFWRGKIDRNPNQELEKDGHRLRIKILDDFDKLCETNTTTIDKLINIFQLGMGYQRLFFIDPSCRNYTDEDGDAIPDAETLASPAGIKHMRIDIELQKKHSMEAQQRRPSLNPSPACVTDLGPNPSNVKASSCALMGGGGNKRPSRKRRSRHRRTRRKYTRRSRRRPLLTTN